MQLSLQRLTRNANNSIEKQRVRTDNSTIKKIQMAYDTLSKTHKKANKNTIFSLISISKDQRI